jgi:hypothetical protein
MRDFSGQLQLIPEALDGLFIGRDLGFEDLNGNLFVDFLIDNLIDRSHPAPADLLDDLVSSSKNTSDTQVRFGPIERHGGRQGIFGENKLCPAFFAVSVLRGILKTALAAFHGILPRESFRRFYVLNYDINSTAWSQMD